MPGTPKRISLMQRKCALVEKKESTRLSLRGLGLLSEDMPMLVNFLRNNPKITYVDLSYNDISNEGAGLLAQENLPVTSFNLSYNRITDDGVESLLSNTIINRLLLDGNSVSEACARRLLDNQSLEHLARLKIGRNLLSCDHPELVEAIEKKADKISLRSHQSESSTTEVKSVFFHHNIVASKSPVFHSNNHHLLIPTKSS